MKPRNLWACLILLAALICGCARGSSTIAPGLPQTPEAVTATAMDGSLASPLLTTSPGTETPNGEIADTPVPTTELPTLAVTAPPTDVAHQPVKTATLTPTPTTPSATIQILAPGPASKVVSPMHVSAYLQKPGAKGKIRVDLLGEDGRLLGRKLLVYAPEIPVHILTDMEFEIPGAAEAGRLVIDTEDDQSRTMALASVDILLMSLGEADINPSGDLLEDIIIQEPVKNTFIQGGSVVVSGLARPQTNQPLLVEMIATNGQHIGPVRLVNVPVVGNGAYSPFTIDVPYSVTEPTWVRLVVYENPGRIPGTSHLSSLEILLGP